MAPAIKLSSIIYHAELGKTYMLLMSKVGCPYDNALMERYYNTLKNEKINLHYYYSEKELDQAVDDFAYIWYNHIRTYSYSNNMTPFEARFRR